MILAMKKKTGYFSPSSSLNSISYNMTTTCVIISNHLLLFLLVIIFLFCCCYYFVAEAKSGQKCVFFFFIFFRRMIYFATSITFCYCNVIISNAKNEMIRCWHKFALDTNLKRKMEFIEVLLNYFVKMHGLINHFTYNTFEIVYRIKACFCNEIILYVLILCKIVFLKTSFYFWW